MKRKATRRKTKKAQRAKGTRTAKKTSTHAGKGGPMLMGAHVLLYSAEPDADRAFIRDVLGFPYVDVGHGWLIFALPPAEVAVHPADGGTSQLHAERHLLGAVLYLMCEDLKGYMKWLAEKKVTCTPVDEAEWGIKTTIRLPSGGEIGLYQPKHKTALELE